MGKVESALVGIGTFWGLASFFLSEIGLAQFQNSYLILMPTILAGQLLGAVAGGSLDVVFQADPVKALLSLLILSVLVGAFIGFIVSIPAYGLKKLADRI